MEIRPQLGPQENFLACDADIVIYGGSAGSGKSYALLLEPLHYITSVEGFGAVIFRRTSPQIRAEGGLWDESQKIYPLVGATQKETTLEWSFPEFENTLKFAHMEHEKHRYDWQGSQICYIGFDELTHFTEKQFWYMLSRNRSMCGIRPYIRATCNPDADHWLRNFLDWWIDPNTGFPISERGGVIRWFIRDGNEIIWKDTKSEFKGELIPKSVTFIPAKLTDNPILMKQDPSYLSNLKALPYVERMKLLEGNWNVRPSAGMYFQRSWFRVISPFDYSLLEAVRFWDRAASEKSEADYTVGLLMAKIKSERYAIIDVARIQGSPAQVETLITRTANQDPPNVKIRTEEEGGASGKESTHRYAKLLAGHDFKGIRPRKDKIKRAEAVSSAAENGLIDIVSSNWNLNFFNEVENFPEGAHDDQVDALSGAFNSLANASDPSRLIRMATR